ncbi:hypothetical protein MW887_002297 [Aspergillus wentii]|nr:hypothetical protein MW887_002297 [Aspergillus wentii]
MPSEKSSAGQGAVNHHEAGGKEKNTNNRPNRERSNSTTAGQAKCSVCQSTFRRPEHLKRHFRSHTKEKPFECAQCGRNFSRTDTLHRHELSHHTLGPEGGKDRTHRITVKTFRACFKCAVARVRCSGGTPCARCDNRTLECEYPTERRSKVKTRKEPYEKASLETENDPHLHESQSHPTQKDGAPRTQVGAESPPPFIYHTSQFRLELNEPNHSTNLDRQNVSPVKSKDTHIDRGVSQVDDTSSRAFLSSGNQVPFSSHNVNTQQIYPDIPNPGIRNTLSTDTAVATPGLDQEMRSIQSGIVGRNIDIEMASANSQQAHLGFDQPFFDQSMLSTINWLPNDLFPDAMNDPSRLSQPSYSRSRNSSLAQNTWLPPIINAGHASPSLPEDASQPPGSIALGADLESPNRFNNAIGEVSSHPETGDVAKRPADYYADGTGVRFPKYRRKHSSWSESADITNFSHPGTGDTNPRILFPIVQEVHVDSVSEEEATLDRQIESSIYDQIHHNFLTLCCTENFLYRKFDSENFPSADTLSGFIHLFFDSFQSACPLFHSPTFNPNRCHWLVTLAVSTIGCRAAKIPEAEDCAMAFDEFLRRAINVEKEKCRLDRTPLWLLQAMLLSCIGLLHNSDERSRLSALSSFGDLITFTTRERLLSPSSRTKLLSDELSQERKWTIWIEDEVRRRTGYLIWLVDCTLAYHLDTKPFLSLDDSQAPLPCHESLWQVKSAGAWEQLFDKSSGIVSLYDAVHIMYIEKRLVPGIAEFSHILLIHALYHRMWEVGDYFRRPLSFWNPTAKKQTRNAAIPSGSVWLPGIPSYSKWRNSACDCLDILHWTANSTITKASGLEHPTVLHLHVARIVLLTPFREIRSLATSLAMEKIRWGEHQQTIEWHYILRWIKHDQYKARLAIIHAGTTLWHIRRYSRNSFHEPMATFLAILTLWTYGKCNIRTPRDSNLIAGSKPDPTFIHLDRPCDDELVQLFVREGQTMVGNLTGAGDICAPQGPERVLRVGCEILEILSSWSISKKFIVILTRLAELNQA